MEKNYNFKRNISEPSSERIAQHMDFASLMQQFEATQAPIVEQPKRMRPLRRVYLWTGAAAAVLLAGVLLYIGMSGEALSAEEYRMQETAFFNEQPYVNPPLASVKPSFANYKVNANEGGIFEYENGSRLVVPSSAFMNDRGELIEGDVDIKYREFHDYVDFFLSGIPMVYDSAGIEYNLESAGMMEIYAEQNGVRVNMAPGKTIDVELVSSIRMPEMNVPPKFNIYKLDEEARNWVYQAVDNIEIVEETFADLDEDDPLYEPKREYRDALAVIETKKINQLEAIQTKFPQPSEPVKPRRRNGTMPSMELDFLDNLNNNDPESAALREKYDGVVWQISPNSPPFNENATNILWEDFSLEKVGARDFELTLIKGTNQLKILINPVLNADQYQAALATFEQELVAFQEAKAERDAKIAQEREALEAKLAEERALAEATYEERLAKYRAAGNGQAASNEMVKQKIINRFQASSLGTWNCDIPLPPYVFELNASFKNKKGQKFIDRTGYLVDRRRNTVQKFYVTEGTRLRFDKNTDNLLWLVTPDNKIARFQPEDFKRINQSKGDYVFELDVVNQEIKDEEDIRKILDF